MVVSSESKLISKALEMNQNLTNNSFDANEIMRIYLSTPISDYFIHDASMGGYVPHKRRLRRKHYFI